MSIRLVREISIRCDEPGCFENDVEETINKKQGIVLMRKRGWSINGKTCLCPEHRKRA